jgi:hypothetical protein
MKSLVIIVLLSWCFASFAQTGNVSVYSSKGLKFTVVLNGIDQNDQPSTHVKVTDVPEGSYRIKVRFENEKLGQASRGMFVEPGKEYRMSVMHKSAATVDHHFDGVHNQMVKTLGNDPNAKANNWDVMENYVIRYVSEATATSNGSSNEQVVAFKARTRFSNPANEISEGGVGGFGTTSTKTVKPTEVATATPAVEAAPRAVETSSSSGTTSSYSSACTAAMDENTYSATKSGVSAQTSPELKGQVAKQIINAVCMSVEQISGVSGLIPTDAAKLDFVKYGFDYCFDPQNYASLSSIFEAPESVDAFNQFLVSKQK